MDWTWSQLPPPDSIFDWFCHRVSQFIEGIELAPLLYQQLVSSRLCGCPDCLALMQLLPQIRRSPFSA
jgi:hypothetical protein